MDKLEAYLESLDKSNWKTFKFSDIAANIVEKVTPKGSDLQYYIGLEHLDAGSIHIKRFGDPLSLDGDKLKIYKGDVIVGKRNAYLRRASMAPCDAVASAHSFVLRPNAKVILPELFPFFMLSDSFWDVAVRISVGSLSPTINWKTLAIQEFLLPPKDQQARIAELLWAADDVVQKYGDLEIYVEQLKRFYQEDFFLKESKSNVYNIGKIAQVVRGKFTHRPRNEPRFYGGEIPFIQTSDVVNASNGLITSYSQTLNELGLSISKLFPCGTIVMTIAANIGDVAELSFDAAFPDSLVGLLPNNEYVEKEYFFWLLKANKKLFEKNATKGAQMNLNNEILNSIKINVHPKNEQRKIASLFSKLNNTVQEILAVVNHSKLIQKQLINQVFG